MLGELGKNIILFIFILITLINTTKLYYLLRY